MCTIRSRSCVFSNCQTVVSWHVLMCKQFPFLGLHPRNNWNIRTNPSPNSTKTSKWHRQNYKGRVSLLHIVVSCCFWPCLWSLSFPETMLLHSLHCVSQPTMFDYRMVVKTTIIAHHSSNQSSPIRPRRVDLPSKPKPSSPSSSSWNQLWHSCGPQPKERKLNPQLMFHFKMDGLAVGTGRAHA